MGKRIKVCQNILAHNLRQHVSSSAPAAHPHKGTQGWVKTVEREIQSPRQTPICRQLPSTLPLFAHMRARPPEMPGVG